MIDCPYGVAVVPEVVVERVIELQSEIPIRIYVFLIACAPPYNTTVN